MRERIRRRRERDIKSLTEAAEKTSCWLWLFRDESTWRRSS